ncbi:hypothetical protein OIU85_014155 [Salix viminalis]|uniref:Uncharacterized protein n=1 Tax=Salix viminalis TaxID=40686 RepID=A0A9Q0NN82_SALVM|nr:hypothetical protein OIU85_014155 [Salix viminalis]
MGNSICVGKYCNFSQNIARRNPYPDPSSLDLASALSFKYGGEERRVSFEGHASPLFIEDRNGQWAPIILKNNQRKSAMEDPPRTSLFGGELSATQSLTLSMNPPSHGTMDDMRPSSQSYFPLSF